jgi:class 3 adenylate cyclase/tetratricopeptide (TPR) repeat protein
MQCPRCQHENEAGAKFCEGCAASLARTCANCGRLLSPRAKFCPECAHPAELSKATPPVRRFGSPDSYTPKHLAEKILTSRSALEGERKQVTVLFADMKGSMELLADRDPEEARKILDPVIERMMEAVHWYEGTVNQVMGDGIMALFGAPIGHEDHAVRACYAALRMQRRVNLYADEIQRAGGTPVHIRVGLNSGEVVVSFIGSDLHMDYTAVGQTTHLAARMEQMAKPGSVLVTGETLALAEGYVQVRPLGAVTAKGLETPTQVYELSGIGLARSRLQASAARGLTRFVGRTSELQQLAQALDRAAAGYGQVVAVVGEAGVGKSRLFLEFTRSHHTHGWLVLQSGSVSYGKATLYLPVIDLLKSYFNIQDRDGHREIRERVAGKLLILDRALEPLLTPLLALLDVPVDDAAWTTLDPPQRRRRTMDAVKRLLLRESQVQPLVVVFEDLHWIDSETQALLDGLIESLPTARVLLLVNYRPEYEHAWGRKTFYLQLRIDPLPPESAEELLNVLLGEDRTLEPLKRVLIERTEGNPFFLEESVRVLVETGALPGERGAYRLAQPLPAIHVPATVQAVLAARIDRLPPGDKAILQVASVVGKDVPFALLQAIAEPAEDELRAVLGRLQGAEFLYETSLFPDLEYTFKHALTHEVTYGSLLQDRRRTLHGQIVEAIERLYHDRLPEHIERLAYHAFRGEAWEKAIDFLHQAGKKAVERSAYREATACFEQALDVLRHLPPHPEWRARAIDLHLEASRDALMTGERTKTVDHARQAEALAESLGDESRRGWALVQLAICAWNWGDSDRALELDQRALDIANRLKDVALQTWASNHLGWVGQTTGDYRQSAEILSRVAETVRSVRHVTTEAAGPVNSLERLAWCLAELGEFGEAIARGEEALRIAREVDQPTSLIRAYRSLGFVSLRRGAISQAIPPLERAIELCRTAEVRVLFEFTAAHLGYAYALSARLPEGVSLLEDALADPEATGTTGHPLFLAYLGEAHLLAGRRDDAFAVAGRALDLAHRQKEQGNEAWVLRLLGDITAHADPPNSEPAERYYAEGLARANELGMRPLQAHCHLGLGKLYHRTSDGPKAEEHLTTSAAMYRDMDMGFWLEKAEAALQEPGPRAGR